VILYRPVGLDELRRIFNTGMCEFPPRFPLDPILYLTVDENDARQISKARNAQGDSAGFVIRFEVDDTFVTRFEPHHVGDKELRVPAEDLGEFNRQITGVIEVVASHFGPYYGPGAGISEFDDYVRILFQVYLLETPTS